MTIGCGFRVSFPDIFDSEERNSYVYAIDPSHDKFLVYCGGMFKWVSMYACKLYVGL